MALVDAFWVVLVKFTINAGVVQPLVLSAVKEAFNCAEAYVKLAKQINSSLNTLRVFIVKTFFFISAGSINVG